MSEFTDDLRLARLKRRIKQTDMARQLGVSVNALSNWENGRFRPPNDVLREWATALDLEVPEGVEGWAIAPCGTDAAYARHLRRREETCEPCRKAHAEALKSYRRRSS